MSKENISPYMEEIGRLREEVGRLKAENTSLKDFKDRIMQTIYKSQELDEHGNSKPYRFDHLIMELREAANNEFNYQMPWRIAK